MLADPAYEAFGPCSPRHRDNGGTAFVAAIAPHLEQVAISRCSRLPSAMKRRSASLRGGIGVTGLGVPVSFCSNVFSFRGASFAPFSRRGRARALSFRNQRDAFSASPPELDPVVQWVRLAADRRKTGKFDRASLAAWICRVKPGNDASKKITKEKEGKRNADRRVSNRPRFRRGSVLSGSTLACRRSTAALPGDVGTSPSSFRPGFLARGALRPGSNSCATAGTAGTLARRALPAPACPSPVAPTAGHSAGGVIPKAAREQFARLPAGTALAPYVGSHPDYVPDVSEIRSKE